MQEACLGSWRNSEEASVAGEEGVRTGVAAVGGGRGLGTRRCGTLEAKSQASGFLLS